MDYDSEDLITATIFLSQFNQDSFAMNDSLNFTGGSNGKPVQFLALINMGLSRGD